MDKGPWIRNRSGLGAALEVGGLGHWGEEGRFEIREVAWSLSVNKCRLLGSVYQGLKFWDERGTELGQEPNGMERVFRDWESFAGGEWG